MRVPIILFASVLLAVFLISCAKKDKQVPQDQKDQSQMMEAVPVVSAEEQLVQSASQKLCARFTDGLRTRLAKAISETGPAGALQACGTFESQFQSSLTAPGWAIQRISNRVVNTKHLPEDSLEAITLRRFARDTSVHFWSRSEHIGSYRNYTCFVPIYTEQICLNCHGDPSSMDERVVSALAQHYPANQATGYKLGDFRGMYAVTVVWPTAEPYAKELVNTPTP